MLFSVLVKFGKYGYVSFPTTKFKPQLMAEGKCCIKIWNDKTLDLMVKVVK